MKKATMMRGLAAAMLFAGLSPIACGSDSGSKGTTAPDKTATTPDAGPPPSNIPAGSVACGPKVCGVPEGTTGTACCANAFEGICGVISPLGGGCGKAPPPPPKECPMLPSIGGVIMLRGCCTDKGECGVDGSMIGMGCNNYADAMNILAMITAGGGMGAAGGSSMFNVTLPAEAPCTPPAAN